MPACRGRRDWGYWAGREEISRWACRYWICCRPMSFARCWRTSSHIFRPIMADSASGCISFAAVGKRCFNRSTNAGGIRRFCGPSDCRRDGSSPGFGRGSTRGPSSFAALMSISRMLRPRNTPTPARPLVLCGGLNAWGDGWTSGCGSICGGWRHRDRLRRLILSHGCVPRWQLRRIRKTRGGGSSRVCAV